jgi:transcriptional regulator with XRE-family HTH domain
VSVNVPYPLQNVKQRRQLLGLSAQEVAKRLGMNVQSYWRLERGERRIYLDKALILAQLLDCTVEQLGQLPTEDEIVSLVRRRQAVATVQDDTLDVQLTEAPQPAPIAPPVEDEEVAKLVAQWESEDHNLRD